MLGLGCSQIFYLYIWLSFCTVELCLLILLYSLQYYVAHGSLQHIQLYSYIQLQSEKLGVLKDRYNINWSVINFL